MFFVHFCLVFNSWLWSMCDRRPTRPTKAFSGRSSADKTTYTGDIYIWSVVGRLQNLQWGLMHAGDLWCLLVWARGVGPRRSLGRSSVVSIEECPNPGFFTAVIQAWTTDDRRDRQKAFGCRSSHNWWSVVLPKFPPYIFCRSCRSSVDYSFFGPLCARETLDVYWSGRGGSAPVGLLSVVGRFSFSNPYFSVVLFFSPSSVVFHSNFQAQTVVLGLLVWAMCIYSSLFYLALHLLISFKPALGWLLLSPFFHVLPAFLQLLMFYLCFSWFWNTCIFTSYFRCFGILFLHTFGLVFGLHFCPFFPSKIGLFTKHRKLRCMAYIWVFTSCWSSSWVLFWCFNCVFSWFWNAYIFTSCFSCFGILLLHACGLVFGLHFCQFLPSKICLFTKHRKLRCMAYIWVFTSCWSSSWVLFWCFNCVFFMVLEHLYFYLIFSMFWHPVAPYFWSCFWPSFLYTFT